MINNKKKPTGLGVSSYFEDTPSLEDIQNPSGIGDKKRVQVAETSKAKEQHQKIRKTYVISPKTQLALEIIRLEIIKRGQNANLGDLVDEAVLLLAKEKGVQL